MDAAYSNQPSLLPASFEKLPNPTGTMRTRILVFCGVVLAVCLWLLLRQHAEAPKPTAGPEAVAVSANPPVVQSQPVNPPSAPPAVAGQLAPNVPAPAVA